MWLQSLQTGLTGFWFAELLLLVDPYLWTCWHIYFRSEFGPGVSEVACVDNEVHFVVKVCVYLFIFIFIVPAFSLFDQMECQNQFYLFTYLFVFWEKGRENPP